MILRTCTRAMRSVAIAVFIIALIACRASAIDLHVDSNAPPGGDGSVAAPLDELADIAHYLQNGDTIRLRGVFRGQTLYFADRNDVTITGWGGDEPRPMIRGDLPIDPASWQLDEKTGVYYTTISQPPVRVMWNWDKNIDEHGRRFGFLRPGLSAQGLAPGEWFAIGTLLHIKPPPNAASADPRDGLDGYSWIVRGNALRTTSTIGGTPIERIVVRGVDFALWAYASEVDAGYGVRIEAARDSLIEDCTFTDCGKHSAGFVGMTCEGNVMRGIVADGLDYGSFPSAGHLVFFSQGLDIDDCLAEDCDLGLYGSLDWAGLPIPGRSVNGVFTHTANSALVRGVVVRRTRCRSFEVNSESPLGVGARTVAPAQRDSLDPLDYPVRFEDCVIEGAARLFFASGQGQQAAAFVRCKIDLSKASELAQWWAIRVQGTDSRMLFQSCVISAVGGGLLTTESRLFDIPPENSLLLSGCIVHIAGPVGTNPSHIRQSLVTNPPGWPNSMVVARQTVFSRDEPGSFHRGNNLMTAANLPSSLRLHDCWFWNIDPEQYSQGNWTIRTQAAFAALIDPAGVYTVDPGYAAPGDGDFEGVPGSPLRSLTRWISAAARRGIDGAGYSGHFGAHQYGSPIGDLSGDGLVNSVDLASLLGSWGPCPGTPAPCPADFNGDGAVGSPDLALLLGSWSN